MVEDLGDLGQGGDVGVVEGVDAAVDVVTGPVAHEAAADGVFDAGSPGAVGGAALAQQMRGDSEAEVATGEVLGDGRLVEGVAIGVLAGAVRGVQARNQAGGGVDLAGVGVGVERLDRHADQI